VYFCGSSHDPLSDGIVIAHVAIVEANCSLQTSLSESLQLFFRGSGTARLHGSCRQSDFSFSYALVGVGRLVISGNMSSCSSSVADDAAISHVSTVEWAFWELSATDIPLLGAGLKRLRDECN